MATFNCRKCGRELMPTEHEARKCPDCRVWTFKPAVVGGGATQPTEIPFGFTEEGWEFIRKVGGATESAGTQPPELCPIAEAEVWLAERGFADSRRYSSPQIAELLAGYAAPFRQQVSQLSGDLRAAQQETERLRKILDNWPKVAQGWKDKFEKAEQDYAREHAKVGEL